ncbi:MAG: hypothetical protein ACYC6R_17335 [Anaerolineales bacterium]
MNKILSTTLIVIAVLALAGGVFFAGTMYARAYAYGPAMMFGYGNNESYGPGMVGGNSNSGYGMMNGGSGYNMMNRNGSNNGANSNVKPLTVDQAKAAAGKYIQSVKLQRLEVGEVMIFDNNAYVIVKESDTGLGAFELLVDPYSQTAYPEFGPNMMWNLKYGGLNHDGMMSGNSMMGANGMMNGWDYKATPSTTVSAEMTVSLEQAIEYAQKYLDANSAGAIAATDPMQFYGYYTLDFERDGKVAGMLSVNGYNGQIFLHTWHGAFIEEAK